MTKTVSFKHFLSVWNRSQGQTTPLIHFQMAQWLEDAWNTGKTRLLLQAFRSSGKSTITGLFAAWLLYARPDLRSLVLAANMNLARKMVRQVRRIIERHPLTGHLRPERADQWGSDRFTVKRGMELRDPSMMAAGISANITGSRADVIICDDVEVPKTCETAGKRENLRERLNETGFVLSANGTVIYIGTPHSWHTIYAAGARAELNEDRAFLDGYERLTIPVINARGESAWPGRYSAADIESMKREQGPNKFKSQMMIEPVNITQGHLDADALQFYDGKLERSAELGGLFLEGKRILSCSAWWDPALRRSKGDSSAFAIVYTDEDGHYRVHRVEYMRYDPFNEDDNATQQCHRVAFLAQMYFVPCVTVETNGVGAMLPGILRREIGKLKAPCAVREENSARNKDLRILEALDAPLAARAIHAHSRVKETPFITEMQEWRPGRKHQRDDGLDAVAGAISLEPVRIKGDKFTGRQNWRGGVHEAKTDFEV